MTLIGSSRRRETGDPDNLPALTFSTTTPDIPIGAPGSYDDVDCNNPNVVWDADNDRWVMYYTAYAAHPTDDGNQDCAIAYADTLDGPWTKDPLNPVYTDESAGAWSQNGGLAKVGSTWVLAYNASTGSMVWFATSPDLHTWTKLADVAFAGNDPFLRVNQDTGHLECYFTRGNPRSVHRRTSTDAGLTWGSQELVVGPAPLPPEKLNGGEPSVYVPPGQEGVKMMVAVDFYPTGTLSGGRGSMLAVTRDGGSSWEWREGYHLASGVEGQWDSSAVFDTFMAHEDGKFYLYYAGSSVPDTGTLNMGIQIGHASGTWDPNTL